MPESLRFPVFLTLVLLVWTGLNAYVYRRLAGLPFVRAHAGIWTLRIAALALWVSFPGARFLDHVVPFGIARLLDTLGSLWLGVLFLLFVALLAADLVTGFGRLLPAATPAVRGVAVILALALSVVAVVQALRPPAVTEYEIPVAGLPPARDKTVLVVVSDLHLGTILSEEWFEGIRAQVERLKPDAILVVGDLVDGNARRVEPLVPALRRMTAPLGVFAVTGNHEYIAGVDRSVRLLEEAGYRVLRDEAVEVAPGLVFAGVDDLSSRHRLSPTARSAPGTDPLAAALRGRPPGATVLLSHSPLRAEEAAGSGVGLMVSGHTHGGQIWPFGYVSAIFYPLNSGRYDVEGMPVLVGRGTGTWGPRMRLIERSEILKIVLRRE